MIGGLLIFLENFLFIIKRLLFHKYMLFAATSTAKWSSSRNWRKTSTRSCTAANMMTSSNRRSIARPTMLVNCLKNRLKIFVFWWCRTILGRYKRVADIVCTDRRLKTFVATACDSSWWNYLVFCFSRRFWSRCFIHFTVRGTLSVILWSMLTLSKLSQLKVFF